MKKPAPKTLFILLLIYCAASLIHFIHNAEFLSDYPGLPASWTSTGVYLAWAGMTLIGVVGWLLTRRGYWIAGLITIIVYAICGLDSLAHYIVAPMSEHTLMMNVTILLEVSAASMVLVSGVRGLVSGVLSRPSGVDALG